MTYDEHALWDRLYNSAREMEAVQSRDRDTAWSSAISILAERHGMY
jgi:hypothetical protein